MHRFTIRTRTAAIALAAATLAACDSSGQRQTNQNAFTWSGDLAAPGVIQIRNTNGPITVEPSPDNRVHVTAATSWTRGNPAREIAFVTDSSAGAVAVCAVWGRGECTTTDYSSSSKRRGVSFGWSSGTDASVAFTVQVPAGVRVDAWTIVGSITARTAAPVRARTVTGSVKVGTSVGPVDAETVNGSVDVRMTTIGDTGAIRAVTKNGTAVAYVPEITDGAIETSTLNGRIGTDFGFVPAARNGRSRKFESSIGAGTREYVVQSLNGSAWLRLINADGTVKAAEQDEPTVELAVPKAEIQPDPPVAKQPRNPR